MNRVDLLKIRIHALHAKANALHRKLASNRYCRAHETPEFIALNQELKGFKKEGREAVFDLLISISHREFMKFIKELDHE
jgi:hypothetical protein